MKNDELLDMIGSTEDALLEKAEAPAKKPHIHWKRYAALAACLVLFASGAAWFLSTRKPLDTLNDSSLGGDVTLYPTEFGDLPMIEFNFAAGSMGFEGYEFYDISELKTGNPWHEDANLTTLPVFENYHAYDRDNTLSHPADEARMLERLREAAAVVGAEIDETALVRHNTHYGSLTLEELRDKFASEEEALAYMEQGSFYMLEMPADDHRFTVDAWLNTRIEFTPSIRLPEGMGFGHHDAYAQYVTSAEYLEAAYPGAFGMEEPTACIEGGDYNIYGEQSYQICFYDAAGDLTAQILSYNFDTVKFACDDVRQLWLIDRKQTDRTHKVGDYPILTPEEAEELFLRGEYLTTVPEEYSTQDMSAAKIELIYRTGNSEKYYLPYYRIYAEIEPDFVKDTDTRNFGVFYVPAVRPEYLQHVEIWDGGFN